MKSPLGLFPGIGKYREIVVSIALFLVFDLGVLVMNFYISNQIAADALGVNLSGRQRMLSQRTVKTLLQAQHAQDNAETDILDSALKELQLTYNLFDTTLNGFRDGATVTGGDGQPIFLQAVNTDKAKSILTDAYAIWNPYRDKLQPLLQAEGIVAAGALSEAVTYAEVNNLKLLGLMNDLTTELETVAANNAFRLRIIQVGGILLALINFFIILFHFIRSLRVSDQIAEEAREETQEILTTVSEGLFLLDREGRIGIQHSKSLEGLFKRSDLATQKLTDVLRELIPGKVLQTTEDYIGILFQAHVNEKLVGDLNPLSEVQVHFPAQDGNFDSHFLEFHFKRVLDENNVLKHLLVTVNDVTARVTLAHELKAAEKRANEQMELLLKLLHVKPDMLREFLERTDQALRQINDILKGAAGKRHQQKTVLKTIFPIVHTIKGDAALLGLDLFESKAHEFEDMIVKLRDNPDLDGNDLLGLTVRLDQLLGVVTSTHSMVDRLTGLAMAFGGSPAPGNAPALTDATERLALHDLEKLIQRMAETQGKKILFTPQGLEQLRLDNQRLGTLREIIVQLARNAVVHGIETPDERLNLGKSDIGAIALSCRTVNDGSVELVFRDDGRGISTDRIREAALRSGRHSEEELKAWDDRRIISLLFESGFSTATEVSTDAGRGVGMDVIKEKLHALGGKLKLSTRPGQSCEWRILLPATS